MKPDPLAMLQSKSGVHRQITAQGRASTTAFALLGQESDNQARDRRSSSVQGVCEWQVGARDGYWKRGLRPDR